MKENTKIKEENKIQKIIEKPETLVAVERERERENLFTKHVIFTSCLLEGTFCHFKNKAFVKDAYTVKYGLNYNYKKINKKDRTVLYKNSNTGLSLCFFEKKKSKHNKYKEDRAGP